MTDHLRLVLIIWSLIIATASLPGQSLTGAGYDIPDSIDWMSEEDLFEQVGTISDEEENGSVLDTTAIRNETENSHLAFSSRVGGKFQKAKGIANGSYRGSSLRLSQKLLFQQGGKVAAGILLDKDPGEERVNDFTSAFAMVHGLGLIRQVIVGDYRLESGQGVAFWRGARTGTGGDVLMPVVRRPRGLTPYLSTDESAYLSGLAAEVSTGGIDFVAGYSRRWLSATLDENGNVSSIYTAGNFRTETEISKKGNLLEEIVLGRGVMVLSDRLLVGISAARGIFSRMLKISSPAESYGNGYSHVGMEFSASIRNVAMSGEWVTSDGLSGGISSVRFSPSLSTDLVASFRRYPAGYQNLHGSPFRHGTSASNEEGIYLGCKTRLSRGIVLSGFYDQYRCPDPRGKGEFPSAGHQSGAQMIVHLVPSLELGLRFQQEVNDVREEIADAYGRQVRRSASSKRRNYRVNIEYEISPLVRMRTRIEHIELFALHDNLTDRGRLIYQDLSYMPGDHLRGSLRLVFFQTDSYDARLSEYEQDVPGVLTLPLLYGTGIRWYLFLDYHTGEKFRCAGKYALTTRSDVRHLGTGLDQLPSNVDSRFSIEVNITI